MADHGTLKAGDVVTSDLWPKGTRRTIMSGEMPAVRGSYVGKRYKVHKMPNERYLPMDKEVDTGDGQPDRWWHEASLQKVL